MSEGVPPRGNREEREERVPRSEKDNGDRGDGSRLGFQDHVDAVPRGALSHAKGRATGVEKQKMLAAKKR